MNRLAGMFWGLLFLTVPVLGVATFAVAPSINVWLPKDVSAHGYEIDSLFYDAKASAKLLAEQKSGYLQ